MAIIAIFIKTYYREDALLNCVNSIKKNFKNTLYRFYIADDGKISSKKRELYNNLIEDGHVVVEFQVEVGASRGRNELLKCLNNEKYILRLDDDFEVTEETNVQAMIEILEENDNIGAVADLERQIGIGKGFFPGEINKWQGNLELTGNILKKVIVPLHQFNYRTSKNGYKYAICDLTRNMILFKRDIFTQIEWEQKLAFDGEHEDLLMQIKYSDWHLAFTIDSIHLHRDDLSLMGKKKDNLTFLNSDNENWKVVFASKWGVSKIILKRPFLYLVKAIIVRVYYNWMMIIK